MKTLSTVLLFTALTAKLAASQDAPPPPGQEGGDGQEGQPGPDGAPPPPPAPAPDVDPNRPNENYPYWVTNDYNCGECPMPPDLAWRWIGCSRGRRRGLTSSNRVFEAV